MLRIGALEVWEKLQPPGERTLNAKFLDAREGVRDSFVAAQRR
jgi:hypothetical protein